MTGTYQTNQTVDWQRPSASHVPDSKFRTALNRSSSMRCLLCKPGLRLNSVTTSVNRCSTVMSGRWRPSFSYCSSTQENRNASCKLLGAWRSLPRNDKVIFRNERWAEPMLNVTLAVALQYTSMKWTLFLWGKYGNDFKLGAWTGSIQHRSKMGCKGFSFSSADGSLRSSSEAAIRNVMTMELRVHPLIWSMDCTVNALDPSAGDQSQYRHWNMDFFQGQKELGCNKKFGINIQACDELQRAIQWLSSKLHSSEHKALESADPIFAYWKSILWRTEPGPRWRTKGKQTRVRITNHI